MENYLTLLKISKPLYARVRNGRPVRNRLWASAFWREEPAPLMNTLKSYVEINGDQAPDKVFANVEKVAEAAITELGKLLNKPWLVSFLANRARQLAGLRELPKFTVIRMMGIIRAKTKMLIDIATRVLVLLK